MVYVNQRAAQKQSPAYCIGQDLRKIETFLETQHGGPLKAGIFVPGSFKEACALFQLLLCQPPLASREEENKQPEALCWGCAGFAVPEVFVEHFL